MGQYVGNSASVMQIQEDKSSPQAVHGNADLTVVMFTDYQCPACRKADPALRAALARDGNVRVVYKDWPVFGERSQYAAKIALAAHRQGIYSAVHHALMNAPSLDHAALREVIVRAGGDWTQLQTDLSLHGPAIADQLAINGRQAFSLGLQGTPGYLVGPRLVKGALTEREFLRAFEQARSSS